MAEKKNVVTYSGLKKIEEELQNLKVNKRREIAAKIKEAREQGDLSENAEYDAAKDEQRDIEARIEQIEQILLTSPGVGRVHAFMIADLDNFKSLNDKLGHMWGDQALQDVAKIMKNDCRPRDVICRLGGDEFVLFLQNLPEREVESFAEGLSGRLHLTYSDGSQSVSITASMGIILTGRSETSFQELYARADKELYEVKRTGKGTWHIKE